MAICRLRYDGSVPDDFRGGAISIGNFDGVHRGHAALLSATRRRATLRNGPAVVVTFHPHPLTILAPHKFQPVLTTIDERARLLGTIGIDHVVILETTAELLALSPEYFFETIVVGALGARAVVEGFNFCFGRNRAGTNELLRSMCADRGMDFEEVSAATLGGEPISSSRVRRAIDDGDPTEARTLIGRPYRIEGRVIRGAGRGRTIGIPTANLGLVESLLPADGVYAVRTEREGRTLYGAANIGPNPTFGEPNRKIEVHWLDYAGDLYDQVISVDFLERIREVRTFPTADALIRQVRDDLEAARRTGDHEAKRHD